MIGTKATPEEFETYVQNIIITWNSATPEQICKGRSWYPVARDMAVMFGDGNVKIGAGIIAALSVQKSWKENIRLATDASAGNVHGHMGATLAKVRAILAGTAPEEVLPMAAKTGNFYRNIVDPSDPDAVTVDRHAHDIAVGEVYGNRDRGLSTPSRYAIIRNAYLTAAKRLGEVASTVQAVTWTVQIDRLAGQGNRGK